METVLILRVIGTVSFVLFLSVILGLKISAIIDGHCHLPECIQEAFPPDVHYEKALHTFEEYTLGRNLAESLCMLREWREARPFLFVGQSAYSQALVMQVIEDYRALMVYKDPLFVSDDTLEAFLRLLTSNPPPLAPLQAPSLGAFLFTFFRIYCA